MEYDTETVDDLTMTLLCLTVHERTAFGGSGMEGV
jgi:hypothetical protein